MKKVVLLLKILGSEQKVKFYEGLCFICEKTEQFLSKLKVQ